MNDQLVEKENQDLNGELSGFFFLPHQALFSLTQLIQAWLLGSSSADSVQGPSQ